MFDSTGAGTNTRPSYAYATRRPVLRGGAARRRDRIRRTAARQHHHRADLRHQISHQPHVVTRRHARRIPVGRCRHAGPVRGHARQRAGGAHGFSGRRRPAAVGYRRVGVGVERSDSIQQGRPALDGVAVGTEADTCGRPRGRRQLHPHGESRADRVRSPRQSLAGLGRCAHPASAHVIAGGSHALGAGLLGRRTLAGVHGRARRTRARDTAVER